MDARPDEKRADSSRDGGVGGARGVLEVMRYKRDRLDPVLAPLLRKTLVAQPADPANFMHALLSAMLSGDGAGPDYASLRAENEVLREQVRVLGHKLAEAQVEVSRAQLMGGGGGGGGGARGGTAKPAAVGYDVVGGEDDAFDEDEDDDGGK